MVSPKLVFKLCDQKCQIGLEKCHMLINAGDGVIQETAYQYLDRSGYSICNMYILYNIENSSSWFLNISCIPISAQKWV